MINKKHVHLNGPEALALKDYMDCLPIRSEFLINHNSEKFEGQRVLEIGAHVGIMSEAILNYCSKLTLIENNPNCVQLLKTKFGSKVKIIEEDVHHSLLKIKPGSFDIIVCAGILYHSASPLFLLESISRLRPNLILLDTLTAKDNEPISLATNTPLNRLNFRYNNGPDCGLNILLSESIIEKALMNMNYKKIKSAGKSDLIIAPTLNSAYFEHWKKSFTQWFKLRKKII